jgi:hypothetical protein
MFKIVFIQNYSENDEHISSETICHNSCEKDERRLVTAVGVLPHSCMDCTLLTTSRLVFKPES